MGPGLSGMRGRVPAILGIAVAAVYLVRAARGIPAGLAYERAVKLNRSGLETRAISLFERGAVGFDRNTALWYAGEAGVRVWDALRPAERLGERGFETVARASRAYLLAASGNPASAWPWSGLAELYGRIETAARARRATDLGALAGPAWKRVGKEGRVAVGLMREAIEREPMVFAHRDALVLLCLRLGLEREAETAMRESARVQPGHWVHAGLSFRNLPPSMLEAFAEGSREVLGKAPMLPLERHLLSLAQLELRLGRLDDAEAHLERAMLQPADGLRRAEQAYHLGLVRKSKGDFCGARKAFELASQGPVFRSSIAYQRGRMEEAEGRAREALDLFEEALRLEPRNVFLALECARAARGLGEWKTAEETLRWAILVAPEDGRPRADLVRTLLAAGDRRGAARALGEMREAVGRSPEVLTLERDLAGAGPAP